MQEESNEHRCRFGPMDQSNFCACFGPRAKFGCIPRPSACLISASGAPPHIASSAWGHPQPKSCCKCLPDCANHGLPQFCTRSETGVAYSICFGRVPTTGTGPKWHFLLLRPVPILSGIRSLTPNQTQPSPIFGSLNSQNRTPFLYFRICAVLRSRYPLK